MSINEANRELDEDEVHVRKLAGLLHYFHGEGLAAILRGTLPGDSNDDYVVATSAELIVAYYHNKNTESQRDGEGE